jgi:uncharacterized protein (TIGR03032 family)
MGNALFDMRPAAEIHPPQPGEEPPADAPAPLRSVHTSNFPELLRRLGVSLMVTTYQAGKLVIVREQAGCLNTHFRSFRSPMGMALTPDGRRLALGTAVEIWEFRDVPAVAARLEPPPQHDACYLPRSSHVTGNILIHEMAWGRGEGTGASSADELWFINTRFSCLATLDRDSSFVPRWRPPFVKALESSDRCHLNGMAMVDLRPRYVTALGVSDEPAGWRANKARGGVLIDVQSNEIVARELSMPHSPRWHDGRLWLCESGAGTLGVVELQTGRYEPVVDTPGFTRGLDFAGRYAFVGLSQVRESAVFSGIPITERLVDPAKRMCGVCVVDLRSGEVVAWLQFMDGVQEVFAVQVVPRRYPDLINDNVALMQNSFVVPDAALSEISHAMHVPSGSPGPAPQQAGTSVHS